MSNLTTCIKTASGTIVTPKGRLSYAQDMVTANPKNIDERSGKQKYKVTLLIPPNADITLLKDAANSEVREKFAAMPEHKKKSLKSPFLDAWEKTGDDQFKGWVMLRVTTTVKPAIVDARGQHVSDESEVYSGRWARLSLNCRAYGDKPGAESWGVSFFLSNCQLLDHDEALGGGRSRPENEFVPVDIGAESADNLFD